MPALFWGGVRMTTLSSSRVVRLVFMNGERRCDQEGPTQARVVLLLLAVHRAVFPTWMRWMYEYYWISSYTSQRDSGELWVEMYPKYSVGANHLRFVAFNVSLARFQCTIPYDTKLTRQGSPEVSWNTCRKCSRMRTFIGIISS